MKEQLFGDWASNSATSHSWQGIFPQCLKIPGSPCCRRGSKAGDQTLTLKECQICPVTASLHETGDGMLCSSAWQLNEEEAGLAHRAAQRWQTLPCHQCLHCASSRSSLPCPKQQLVRQKLYQVTGHRNVTFCLMRLSKLPVIWKGCVHARVISLAKGVLVAWQGNKLSCKYVQILAVCRFEILKQIH